MLISWHLNLNVSDIAIGGHCCVRNPMAYACNTAIRVQLQLEGHLIKQLVDGHRKNPHFAVSTSCYKL